MISIAPQTAKICPQPTIYDGYGGGQIIRQYTYDNNGNMTQRIEGSDTFTFGYDQENRLISGVKNSVTLASYSYDGDGRRVKAVENGLTTVYIGDYYEWRSDSTTTTQVKYYYAGGQRIAMRTNGVLTWLLGDHLGSMAITANEDGSLATSQTYTAWGQTRSGSVTTDRQYTGQINEAQLGIYFYNARYYDSYLNRWIQPDSIIPDPYNPLDFDRYSYVRNNPVNFNDPSGHCVNEDKICLAKLQEVQNNYNVIINDKYQAWTLEGLSAIASGMQALLDAMGLKQFNQQFSGITFFIESGDGMWTTGNKDIVIGDKRQNDNGYVKKYTVHELAHIWDNNCNDCLSKGLVQITHGEEIQEYFLGIFPTEIRYEPGGIPPTDYARKNREEDWAESVLSVVLPGSATNNPWDQGRQNYVLAILSTRSVVPQNLPKVKAR